MSLKQLGRVFLVLAFLSSANASVVKLADVLVRSADLKAKIVSVGVSGASVNRLKSFVDTSVRSLTQNDSRSLYEVVASLPVSGEDIKKKQRLLRLLKKNSQNVKNNEFVKAVNDIIFLADRYGHNSISTLSCSVCVSDQLSALGFKTSIRSVGNKKIQKVLRRIPSSPKKLYAYNSKRLRKLGISTNNLRYVSEEDSKTLALFLELASSGSANYKKLTDSIIKFNTKNGKVQLAGPDAPSSLWKILGYKITDDKAQKWSSVISDSLVHKSENKRINAFYENLLKMNEGDAVKTEKVRRMRANNCFFK
ncbi:hypothetical protein [Bacteriovorax sp. DB6_IX]|uniref:hypothetical protein n=1 Tax=Bacteriovorax sp. DB6_IX TaxID=1353530 RepID=UPI000389E59D|nr:hypothetical protein [Bacteriovorax sp. DB6_IX]EQC51328.1 hypothetical protein M901_1631 [Bacteriovorax sp. DB6_IX]